MENNIKEFRKKLLYTINKPDWLEDNSTPLSFKNLAWNGVYNILLLFLDGVNSKTLTKKRIELIVKHIEATTNELDTFLDERQLLLCWIFVGEKVESWSKLAVEWEQYETAANFQKILETFYQD